MKDNSHKINIINIHNILLVFRDNVFQGDNNDNKTYH